MTYSLLRGGRPALWGGTLLLAGTTFLASTGILLAQDPAAPPPPPASSEGAARTSEIETMFVSARKVEERAIDTPVSVTALSSVQIERYNTVELPALSTQIPGLQINRAAGGGAGGNMVIRGIGNLATDYGADQPVALVIDGFSFTRGHIIDVGFFDLDGLEVLKGPQTLFFGKNSPAGVVALRSKSPGDTFEGYVRAGYEFRTENPQVEFGVSYPITNKFRVRLAGRGEFMQGGYLENTAADINRDIGPFETDALYPSRGASYEEYPQQRTFVGRVTAVYEPNDNFDATLKVFGSRSKQNDAGITVLYQCADGVGSSPYLNTVFFGEFVDTTQTCTDRIEFKRNGALPPAAIADANPFIDADDRFFYRTVNFLSTLEMNYRVNDITFTSVTGYWDYEHREYTNYDYTSYAVVTSLQGESGHSWTTEFRARSDWDFPVNFMIGGFYEDTFRDLDAPVQIFPLGPAPVGPWPDLYVGSHLTYHQHWDNDINGYAIFGELRWDITDTLELTAGLRYTDETRETTGGNIFNRLDTFLPPGFNPFSPSGVMYDLSSDFNNLSPQGTLSWKPTPDTLIYGSYKTGFQSAGISNPGTVANLATCAVGCPRTPDEVNDILTFDGSTVKGFEIGTKGLFFGGRVVADLALYRLRYEQLQVAIFNPITTTFTIQNAAVAINQGIEGSVSWQATERLQLNLSAQYNDLKFDEFTDAECYPGQPVTAAPFCHPGPAGANIQDLSDENYGGPPLQVNVGFVYDVPLNEAWSLEVTGNLAYLNKGREVLRQPDTDVPSRTIFNTALRLYEPDGHWEFGVVCSNCNNERYLYGIGNKPLARTGDLTGFIGTPRLVTFQATYNW